MLYASDNNGRAAIGRAVIHQPALDGLRGAAVLSVILFHFGYFSGGWIGVQVFFVLSGYLITSILLSTTDHLPSYFFGRFYWRRTLRIFPLYFGYLLLLAAVYIIVGAPVEFGVRWQYLFSYTYNYSLLLSPLRQSRAFGHFWSLAVEEQFYLLWPFAVYYLSFWSLRAVIVCALVLAPAFRLLSVLLVPWVAPTHVEPGLFAYSPLLAQCDALATGAALAVLPLHRLRRPGRAFGLVTAVTLLLGLWNWVSLPNVTGRPDETGWAFAATVWDRLGSFGIPAFATAHYQHVWSYTIVNLWAAVLIVNTLRGGAIARWLSLPALIYTGTISYGLYVLHYPLLGLLKQAVYYRPFSLEGLAVFLVYLAVTFPAAALSFRYFESWFLKHKGARFTNASDDRKVATRLRDAGLATSRRVREGPAESSS